MKKNKIIIGAIVAGFIAAFIWGVRSGWVTRVMLAYDVGMAYSGVTSAVLKKIPPGMSQKTILNAFRDYVYLTVHPVGKVQDVGPIRVLVNGQGWCDQVADVYTRLIEPLDVRGYLVFLINADGVSPHSVAYITPNQMERTGVAYLQRNAAVVDCQHGVTYLNREGNYASPEQVCKGEFKENPVSEKSVLYCQPPRIFSENSPVSYQPFIKRCLLKWIYPVIPSEVMRRYTQLAYCLDFSKEKGQKEYLLSRINHIYFKYEDAKKGYLKVEREFSETRWAKLAKHYRVRLNDLYQCFSEDKYTGILPNEKVWRERDIDGEKTISGQ